MDSCDLALGLGMTGAPHSQSDLMSPVHPLEPTGFPTSPIVVVGKGEPVPAEGQPDPELLSKQPSHRSGGA